MRVFLVGTPATCGGANSEAGHTAIMLAKSGVEVTCLYFTSCGCGRPVVQPLPDNPWVDRLERAGVKFASSTPGKLRRVAGLPGAITISFCNSHCAHNWPELCRLGCKLIWSPCMCYPLRHESRAFKTAPPTAVHFQSIYQAALRRAEFAGWGCQHFQVIPGALEPLPFHPRVRQFGEPFVVGRLARPCRTKWSPDLWKILGNVREKGGHDVRALCQGWTPELELHLGKPPAWAECHAKDTLTTEEFMSRCDAMICPNWGVEENWPQVGLEAMSAGVPVVADNAGGWVEMISDGEDGLLCKNDRQFSAAVNLLASHEDHRQTIIHQARKRVLQLTDPVGLGKMWGQLLDNVSRGVRPASRVRLPRT